MKRPGWVIVAGRNEQENADDLHVTRADSRHAKQRLIIRSGFSNRAEARAGKNALVVLRGLRRSHYGDGLETEEQAR